MLRTWVQESDGARRKIRISICEWLWVKIQNYIPRVGKVEGREALPVDIGHAEPTYQGPVC